MELFETVQVVACNCGILCDYKYTFCDCKSKILGNITNELFDTFINITIYDQVTASLPSGTKFPEGTKGSDIISKIPAEKLVLFPEDRIEKFKALDLTHRPNYDFDAIAKIALILVGYTC
jgi:hypothetical protein